MSSCTVNRALFNKAIITAENRVRHNTEALYFTLQVWYTLYNINAELNQKSFFAGRVYTYTSIQKGSNKINI